MASTTPKRSKKLNWFLRDWRENEATEMDPKTIDLLWEMHTELGSKVPINIICGYRSDKTNEMLRRTVGGQAKQSYHIRGKAIDAAFPDMPLKQMRYSAIIRERGGVGYYPTSGMPFVHVDSGPVRAWPRLPRYELALLFPNGHTQHKPASGGPSRPTTCASRARAPQGARDRRSQPSSTSTTSPKRRSRWPTPTRRRSKAPAPQPASPRGDARRLAGDAEPQLTAAELQEHPAARARGELRPPSDAERGRLNALVTLASLTTPAAPQSSNRRRRP